MKLFRREFLIVVLVLVSSLVWAQVSPTRSGLGAMVSLQWAVKSDFAQDYADPLPSVEIKPGGLTKQFAPRFQEDQSEYKVYLPIVRQPAKPITYYVSKRGSNLDGQSWTTAWNELDQIKWDVIQPGDTILLDGGSSQMVYTSTLTIGKSGTYDQPITIKLAGEAGRNGKVVIFGGRSTPLPYCGQTDYTFETAGVRAMGILIDSYSWVLIDGTKWRGFTIYGHNQFGIRLKSGSSNITVRNVEIYDNGQAEQNNGQWNPDLPGVNLSGMNNTFERVIIHDNGQDAFQSGGGVGDFTLRQSWLYNGRKHPIVTSESFNYCSHTDGIQIFNGGSLSGFLIEETIIGPGFTNGVVMGQELTSDGIGAVINDVTFRNVLFTKAAENNIMGYPNTKPQRWVIDHVTAHCPNTKWQCLYFEGEGHSVTDSIIHTGTIYLPDGLDTFSGNCQWNTAGFQLGQIADPLFVNVDNSDPFSLDNYALPPCSPCAGKGSSITSVVQLLSQPNK